MLTLKQLGIRRLGGNDIIKAGDLQWCVKRPIFTSVEDVNSMLATDASDWVVGCQVCTEEIQNYPNFFFRKLNASH